jgi:hypothetical protein
MESKLKHLEFIQAVISRMSNSSFLFKGWAITLAAGLSAFAAVNAKVALLVIALLSTLLFWGLDGYYLWLEHCFVTLYAKVANQPEKQIDFSMRLEKGKRWQAFCTWLATCFRPHLWAFYGVIMVVDAIGILVIGSK